MKKLEILTHSTDGLLVDPDQTVRMVAKSDRSRLLPRSVLLSSESASAWEITLLTVGASDQRKAPGPVPIRGGHCICEPEELAQWFRFDPIEVGIWFVMDIVNRSPIRSPFVAHWRCEVSVRACADTWRPSALTAGICKHGYDHACPHGATNKAQRYAFRPEHIHIAPPTRELTRSEADAIVEQIKERNDVSQRRIGNLGELVSGASELDRVPGRQGPIDRWQRTPPGWGWDPHGDHDGER